MEFGIAAGDRKPAEQGFDSFEIRQRLESQGQPSVVARGIGLFAC